MNQTCPLCLSEKVVDYHQDKKRPYLQCNHCELVFVPSTHHLSKELEKAEYDKHENLIEDEGYLKFLSRMATPIIERVESTAMGVDIGCGPTPELAHLMAQSGLQQKVYDPYYHPDTKVLSAKYDFVTCTEVIEHVSDAKGFIEQLISLCKDTALIGIMTKLVIDKERFSMWHYKNDPTHICFYSDATFNYIAKNYGLSIEKVATDVTLFRIHKPN